MKQKHDESIERATWSVWPEAAGLLGIGKNAAYAAASRGEIPTIKVGGRILVPKAKLMALLSNQDTTNASEPAARCQ